MPFRFVEEKEKEVEVTKKKKKSLPAIVRAPVKAASELFGGVVGSLPELAEMAAQARPGIEEREREARPSFLGEAGLEPAPERGLLNLLSLLGETELVKSLTPSRLQESFKKSTGGAFEPQTAVERIISTAARSTGRGLPFGLGPVLGAAAGLGRGISEELGAGPGIQALSEIGGMGLGGLLKKILGATTKTVPRKFTEEAKEFIKTGKREKIPVFRATTEEPFKAAEKAAVAKPSKKSFERAAKMEESVRAAKETVTEKAIPILADIKKGKSAKKIYREAYEEARQMAKNVQGRPNVRSIEKTIDKTIRDLTKVPGETTQVKETLNFLRESYKDITIRGKNTLEGLMGFNARLNQMIYKTGSSERKLLDRVKKANDHVIKSFTEKSNPKIYSKWKLGNKIFGENAKAKQLSEILDPIFTDRGIEYQKLSSLFESPKSRTTLDNLLGKKSTNRLEKISRLASRQGSLLKQIGVLNEREVARRWRLPESSQDLKSLKLALSIGQKSLRSVAKLIGFNKAQKLYGDLLTDTKLQNNWFNYLQALKANKSSPNKRLVQKFMSDLKKYIPEEEEKK